MSHIDCGTIIADRHHYWLYLGANKVCREAFSVDEGDLKKGRLRGRIKLQIHFEQCSRVQSRSCFCRLQLHLEIIFRISDRE